eukprot:scaffold28659_cov129-Isochrysis_galbana.AAC.1
MDGDKRRSPAREAFGSACITTLSRAERRTTGERRASPKSANALACPSMASTTTATLTVLHIGVRKDKQAPGLQRARI